MAVLKADITVPPKFRFLFEECWPYKVLYGGRGAAKSWTVARVLLGLGMCRPLRILCAREFQKSIADSVHKLLSDQIQELGLGSFYDVQKTTIIGRNVTEFIFAGLHHNVESIKSLEGIDICWVEEAERVSEHSWSVLTPTIRKEGSEIWVTFNPEKDRDPTYKRFVTNKPANCKTVKVSWRDNPWFSKKSRAEKDQCARTDPVAYDWIWEGNCLKRTDSQVLGGKWIIDQLETVLGAKEWLGPYFGADWGFSVDPTALVKCWIYEGRDAEGEEFKDLYVEDEAFKVRCEIGDTPALFDRIPDSDLYVIRADSARPEMISFMHLNGFRMQPSEKWNGSVEHGISYLRSFRRIVFGPKCVNCIQEANLYSYKVDQRTGDVLPVLVDKHNHGIDAIRYALGPFIRPPKEPPRVGVSVIG
jgi:phage terminase large subunit